MVTGSERYYLECHLRHGYGVNAVISLSVQTLLIDGRKALCALTRQADDQ